MNSQTICDAIRGRHLLGFVVISDGIGRIVEPHHLWVRCRAAPALSLRIVSSLASATFNNRVGLECLAGHSSLGYREKYSSTVAIPRDLVVEATSRNAPPIDPNGLPIRWDNRSGPSVGPEPQYNSGAHRNKISDHASLTNSFKNAGKPTIVTVSCTEVFNLLPINPHWRTCLGWNDRERRHSARPGWRPTQAWCYNV
jgi:hypothetical protein